MGKMPHYNVTLRVCEDCGSTDDVRWWQPKAVEACADTAELSEGRYLCPPCRKQAEAKQNE